MALNPTQLAIRDVLAGIQGTFTTHFIDVEHDEFSFFIVSELYDEYGECINSNEYPIPSIAVTPTNYKYITDELNDINWLADYAFNEQWEINSN